MATDPYLLDRMRHILSSKRVIWEEKKMFGGDCFMVADKMCFGTFRGGMMVRIEPAESSDLVKRTGTSQMYQRNREMKGYLMVEPIGFDLEEDLEFWIDKCLEYNPKAKPSKKKR